MVEVIDLLPVVKGLLPGTNV